MQRRRPEQTLAADVALGALAGAAATLAMDRTTTVLYDYEDDEAKRREDAARGGDSAFGAAAKKVAEALGVELTDAQKRTVGNALHWALGVGAGAAYGALRRRVPGLDAGQGAAFGTAFFLLVDEGANTALRLAPPPTAFPWQAHARGLAGHLVYGLVAETVLDAADRLR
ncbi:MAG TPA: DUF1440 domain-containing protein [Longimicrobiales bacterium]|nr:DUF1440 domain-containing protein [Longimicrobiales bacterium]